MVGRGAQTRRYRADDEPRRRFGLGGPDYSAAARNLANRYLGILYHCLRTGEIYDEAKAFPHMIERPEPDTTEAA
jgi:hypothetical protein